MATPNIEQEEFEEAARAIVQDTKDYTNFRPYMTDPCPDADICESCMCPHDDRLDATETADAMYACKLSEHGRSKRQNALTTFIQKHCANWDAPSKICVGVDGDRLFHEGPCLVAQGKRCQYFERSVFPIASPSYKYATEVQQYQTLLDLYLKINPNILQADAENIRLCECGTPLKLRRRVCDKCAEKRRRGTRRNSYHKNAS